jgi:hypothetical protein
MKNTFLFLSLLFIFNGCRPDLPPTSFITVSLESAPAPVNEFLYGLYINPENEADGLLSELILNNDFDGGEDVTGWAPLSSNTYISRSSSRPLSMDNPYSLMVSVGWADADHRGGTAAKGYEGIPLKKSERYLLSFFMRTSTTATPAPVKIILEDGQGKMLSLPFEVTPSPAWTKHTHTFIATDDAIEAELTFALLAPSLFFIDQVSLLPEKTWNGHSLRQDIMMRIDSLAPSFILYKGNEEKMPLYRQMAADLGAEFISNADSLRMTEKKFYAGEDFLVSGSCIPADTALTDERPRILATGLASISGRSTLRAAVAEACFLLRAEVSPHVFGRIAFAPVTGDEEESEYPPLIHATPKSSFASPSYYMLKMLMQNRGDMILQSEIKTYERPQVEPLSLDFLPEEAFEPDSRLVRKNAGRDTLYNYEFTGNLVRTKKVGAARIRITPSVFISFEEKKSVLYKQSGLMRDTLSISQLPEIIRDTICPLRIIARYDTLKCYAGDTLIHSTVFPSLPSIIASATLDKKTSTILLKVVNTSRHDEITEIVVRGASLNSQVRIVEIRGDADMKNSFDLPHNVIPVESFVSLPIGGAIVYKFPPNSITLMKLIREN